MKREVCLPPCQTCRRRRMEWRSRVKVLCGTCLADLRRHYGLTLHEAARRFGIRPIDLAALEQSFARTRPELVAKVVEVYGQEVNREQS